MRRPSFFQTLDSEVLTSINLGRRFIYRHVVLGTIAIVFGAIGLVFLIVFLALVFGLVTNFFQTTT